MQCSPQEIKEKLLRHLDNDYNVVDLQGVFDVMSVLERYPITKEHLEQTRLGKYVNEMRRRTADRNLARRAKDLVRKWQQLVTSQSSSSSFQPAGSSALYAHSPAEISRVASSGSLAESGSHGQPTNSDRTTTTRLTNGPYPRQSSSAGMTAERQLSPANTSDISGYRYETSPGRSGDRSTARSTTILSRPLTPMTSAGFLPATFKMSSRPTTPSAILYPARASSPQLASTLGRSHGSGSASSSKLSPMYSHCITNGTKDDASEERKLKLSGSSDTLFDVKCKYANGHNGMLKPSSSASNLTCNGVWSVHLNTDRNSGMASPPDLQRVDAPLAKLKIKINRSSATGSVSSPVAELSPAAGSRKAPKVATTAELIQRLHANGELRLVASETLNRIATNQIEHEVDDPNASIVPEGVKPRPHKKRRTERLPDQLPPAMTDSDLLQVKAERVRNFVQMSASSAAGSPTAGDDLLGLLSHLPPPATTDTEMYSEPVALPPADVSPAPKLPSLVDFEIDWSSNSYTVPDVRPPPTEVDVDRLLSEEWPSVNGQFDYRGEWTDWTQSYSARGYDGSLVHILPYVDIDD